MGKYIYQNGHINTIQPYYFMYNGQRYNAAHFNGRIVFATTDKLQPAMPKWTPFYVENITDTNETLSIRKGISEAPTLTIYYSTDGMNWLRLGNTSTAALTRTIVPGEKLYLRCNTNAWAADDNNTGILLNMNIITGVSKIGGNIMSLLYGRNFTGNEISFPTSNRYVFHDLFRANTNLQSAEELMLPVTTLKPYCYSGMFQSCTSLTTAPELPATQMAEGCYRYMFVYCTSLTTAPELPSMSLNSGCYESMFGGCTSLTTAPELPATKMQAWCYNSMFSGCTSLTTAPDLPATSLTALCYNRMFYGCTNLNSIKCLATYWPSYDNDTEDWLYGVAQTGTFYKAAGTTWPIGTSGIPTGWTVVEV